MTANRVNVGVTTSATKAGLAPQVLEDRSAPHSPAKRLFAGFWALHHKNNYQTFEYWSGLAGE